MLSTGNSDPEHCVNNLLNLTEGEVHIDQCRGLRADLVDQPASTVAAYLQAHAFWLVRNYEPRVDFAGTKLSLTNKLETDFSATANLNL